MRTNQSVLVLALLIIWLFPASGWAQNWHEQTPINASVDFNGVHFISDQSGYAVGTGGTIYKTLNGGLSWTAQSSNTTEILNDIYFITATTGYAVGDNGTIRKTTDGGTTWSTVTVSGTATTSFQEIQFLTATTGYVVGSGGKVIRTTDGINWTTVSSGTTANLTGLHFTSTTTGYFVGAGGVIKKTTNGGTNWSPLTLTTTENFNDIYFIDANTGYTAGTNGEIWQTTNAGANWALKNTGMGSLELFSIFFTDANNGYASSSSGYQYVTSDGAQNWIAYQLPVFSRLNDTHFSSVYTGYMVGTGGVLAKYQSELEPEIQPSALTFTEVYATSLKVSYTASPDIPTGYIAIRKTGSLPTTDPMDGITYALNQTLGDGTVVFIGNGLSFTQNSLAPGTTYYYKIYAYNGAGTAINYRPTAPLDGSKTTYASGLPWNSSLATNFSFPRSIHFYDANNGGAAGGYNLETTADGGTNWLDGFSGNGDVYTGIYFTTPTTGYLVGVGNGTTRVIRRTVNGGASWVDQVRATTTYGLNDVWFANSITGFAVGEQGNILRTTNGVSWSTISSGTPNTLLSIQFPTAAVGYAVGISGTIIKTTSGGTAWLTLPGSGFVTSQDLHGVFFTDAITGWVVGNSGTILKTTDGGTIWATQSSGTTQQLNDVHFIDANTGYVAGMAGTILKTTNGGTDWYPFQEGSIPTMNYYGVNFPTPYIGYVVGYQGTTGAVLKYSSVPEPGSQPGSMLFSSIASTSLVGSYSPPLQTTDGYLVVRKVGSAPTAAPLDGIAYTVGTILGDGVVAYSGPSTSFLDINLTPGTNYYYNVYAYNKSDVGASTNYRLTAPLQGSTTTTLIPPVAASATTITATGFTANWGNVSGASSYQLDVSSDGFNSFVSGYNSLLVVSNAQAVVGLLSGTTYSYRIRAVNVSGPSTQSNQVAISTVPAPPVPGAVSGVTSTGLTLNWAPSVGAAGYFLDLSTNNFSTFVSGYNNLAIAGTTQSITGLTAGTPYQFRIRALNGSGTSTNSSSTNTITLCDAPTATAASAVTVSSFTANWSAITGAADYRIDVSSDPSFSFVVGSYNNQTVAGTSLSVTGLNAGTNYYYRVRAVNVSGSSASSGPINVLTLPTAPVANDATSVGSATFGVSWNAVSTATSYFMDVSTSNIFSTFVTGYNNVSVPSTSTVISVPVEGITYYYRVRAVNGTGVSANSNTITTLLKPAIPVASAATGATGNSFTANWSSASGATGYTLEVSSDNFVSNIPGYDNLSVTGTSSAVINLLEGVTYKYRLRATNASYSSANSNAITIITAPPVPVALAAVSITTTGLTAKWSPAPGAASYQLDISTNNFLSFIVGYNSLSVSGTSAVITGLTAGTTYQYRLRAVNTSGTSLSSNVISTTTISVAPTANTSIAITSTGLTSNWGAVTGATDYRLDVSVSNAFTSFEGVYNNFTVSGTSIAVTGLTPGLTYYYRVRANNASGPSAHSNTITTLLKPQAPNATAATLISTTGFTANWDAVAGATGYRLDVSVNDFISNLTGYSDLSVATTSQNVTGLAAGTTYKFRVRALNTTGASDNSNLIASITVPPAPVATAATLVSTSGFTANWNTISGVPAYFLDVSVDAGFTSFLTGYNNFATSLGSQTITGLSDGTTYYYRVRGANFSGTSTNSGSVTTITLPLAPAANAASAITATGFSANWSAVSGASEYRIDVSTDNAFSFFVGSYFNQLVSGTSLSISGLTAGTTYFYRVRAANNSGSSTNSSTRSVLTLPAAPVANDAIAITSSTFTAGWNAVSTATGYLIDVSTASNFTSFVTGYNNTSVSGTSLMVTLPVEGTTYYYRVRSVSAAGTSASSNTISTLLKPSAPVANAATLVAADGFTASWSAAPGATGYYLDVSANNFSSLIQPYDNFLLAGTSIAISGLSAGTTYQFRVRSYNATGSSSNSAAISVITIPPAPVTTSSTSFTTNSFIANWQSTAGATSYRLDVSSDPNFGAGTFIVGYNNLTVNGTSATISNLAPGTISYYRVRAVNTSGTSPNSNVTSSSNIPAPPAGLFAASITTTGFTANWSSTSGAISYALDISTTNFSTFVNGYNSLSVTGTSSNVIGLAPGTTYQYRVRAINLSGTSVSSSALIVDTLPEEPLSQPSSLLFTNITTTSMKISFSASSGGAAGYVVIRKVGAAPTGIPADGTPYNAGSTIGDSKVIYSGPALNFDDSGLTAGTTYHYAVFAFNGATFNINYKTTTPLTGSQVTMPDAPILSAASAIGQHGFTANWTPVTGATGYSLDVSADNFATFVTGFQQKSIANVTSTVVTGLLGGSAWQYRLRAVNSAGASLNAGTQTVLTIPETPVGLVASSITATGFVISWTASSGSDGYYVDLSTDNTFTVLTVNNAATIDPTLTFSGLANATAYSVRIRAGNVSGTSTNSDVLKATTLAGGGGPSPLVVGTPNYPATMKGAAVTVSVNVTGGTDPKTVTLYYKKLVASSYSSMAAVFKTGTSYEAVIEPEMTDELGVEFYVKAVDAANVTDESDLHHFIFKSIDASSNQTIPFEGSGFNGQAETYQMFSVPYALSDKSIANLFEPALNGFSNTRWRLLRYTNGALANYPDQLKKIELGEGYWFNTIQADFQIKLAAGIVNQVTPSSPFTITLEKGWNQIGNPFPFNINWNTVVDANPNAGLNAIWLFENGSFVRKDVLAVWKGAFVFSEQGGQVTFPLTAKTTASGRDWIEPAQKQIAGEWHLPMMIEAGKMKGSFSVGMRSDARTGKDYHDEIAIPRFLSYLEATTHHPEFFAPDFSGDVVPVDPSYTWDFTLGTNLENKPGSISWDKAKLSGMKGTLVLWDTDNSVLMNMKLTGQYDFVPKNGQGIKIIYYSEGEFVPAQTQLTHAYPNPFSEGVTIPVFLEKGNATIRVEVYNAMGQPVKIWETGFVEPGYHEITWDGAPSGSGVPIEGLLLYRISVNGAPTPLKRLVKIGAK
jgi:photosystem II stability/assembly factor-like uncharacterized protein